VRCRIMQDDLLRLVWRTTVFYSFPIPHLGTRHLRLSEWKVCFELTAAEVSLLTAVPLRNRLLNCRICLEEKLCTVLQYCLLSGVSTPALVLREPYRNPVADNI
jgi:hypothetical protein